MKFPGSIVTHLNCNSSYHCPLLINLSGFKPPPRKCSLRFEEIWLSDERCFETVEASWSSVHDGTSDECILKKIEACGKDLAWWNKNIFGNVKKELEKKKAQLAQAEREAIVSGMNHRVCELKEHINVLLDKEARLWCQCSRVLWLKNGDNNTKFFHCQASKRHRRNLIHGIRDETNNWQIHSEPTASVFIRYYQELFATSKLDTHMDILDHIPRVITEEMNAAHTSSFLESKVVTALKQMAPLKASGPNGMLPLFYQHFWGLVDNDVTSSVLSWLNSGTLPHPLNHTFITLIPKTKNFELVQEFRPISLCNVLYKIFSKVLTNRLKKVLPLIITEHQSAFTKNRLIPDNILVAFESLQCMENQVAGDTGYMAIKLDMSKAYDLVERVYLENIMRKMGFCEQWIGLIMACVQSMTYSILVNGEPHGLIHPTRGIRQGDPLSSFLFLLCTEGLNGLIQQAAIRGYIKGFSLCQRGPKLTHLLFANDSLIFCRATQRKCG